MDWIKALLCVAIVFSPVWLKIILDIWCDWALKQQAKEEEEEKLQAYYEGIADGYLAEHLKKEGIDV